MYCLHGTYPKDSNILSEVLELQFKRLFVATDEPWEVSGQAYCLQQVAGAGHLLCSAQQSIIASPVHRTCC